MMTRDPEQIIREIDWTMRVEGMPLTEEDKSNLRICIADPSKIDAMIQSIVEHYTRIYKNERELG